MEDVFEHRTPGRRPTVWLAAAVFAFLLFVALQNGAPWYVWALWAPCAAALLYLLIRNPIAGMRLDRHTFTHWDGHITQTIALADIDYFDFDVSGDTHWVTVHLHDGRTASVFSLSTPSPSRTIAALAARGVRTVRH